jgi:hypothetical protein
MTTKKDSSSRQTHRRLKTIIGSVVSLGIAGSLTYAPIRHGLINYFSIPDTTTTNRLEALAEQTRSDSLDLADLTSLAAELYAEAVAHCEQDEQMIALVADLSATIEDLKIRCETTDTTITSISKDLNKLNALGVQLHSKVTFFEDWLVILDRRQRERHPDSLVVLVPGAGTVTVPRDSLGNWIWRVYKPLPERKK